MWQTLVPQENLLLRRRKVGICLMEHRFQPNNLFVVLSGVSKCIRPKTILTTHGNGKGNHGEISSRAVVCREIYAIIQTDIHSVAIEKSMTTKSPEKDLRAEKLDISHWNMITHKFNINHSTSSITKKSTDEPFPGNSIRGREVFNRDGAIPICNKIRSVWRDTDGHARINDDSWFCKLAWKTMRGVDCWDQSALQRNCDNAQIGGGGRYKIEMPMELHEVTRIMSREEHVDGFFPVPCYPWKEGIHWWGLKKAVSE
jgi:hypothetical protein